MYEISHSGYKFHPNSRNYQMSWDSDLASAADAYFAYE